MSVKRIVDTRFWEDDKVIDYFSPEDKLFMLYLLTNPHTTQLGIYPINRKQIAFELGYSIETIDILLERFETKYKMIIYSNETKEIAIKNYLKYSVIKGGKPVEDLINKELKQVKNKELIKYVFNNISNIDNINVTINNIIHNYNDNDNDDSYHESYHESCKTSKKLFVKPSLEEIKKYCKERNNNVDAQKFFDYYEVAGWKDSSGKPVKNWKQKMIANWEKEKKEETPKPKTKEELREEYAKMGYFYE